MPTRYSRLWAALHELRIIQPGERPFGRGHPDHVLKHIEDGFSDLQKSSTVLRSALLKYRGVSDEEVRAVLEVRTVLEALLAHTAQTDTGSDPVSQNAHELRKTLETMIDDLNQSQQVYLNLQDQVQTAADSIVRVLQSGCDAASVQITRSKL